MIKGWTIALLLGLAVASIPWALQNNDALRPIQLLMIPGLIFAVVVGGGNIHTYSLTTVFIGNIGFYALPIYFYLRHRTKIRT